MKRLPALLLVLATTALTLSSSSASTLDLCIVGGGPGGLAAALAVRRNAPSGTNIAILERDIHPFEPKGASIVISKDGWRSLEDVDPVAKERVGRTSVPVMRVAYLEFDEPPPPSPVDGTPTDEGNRFGAHLWHDVRSALADRVLQTCGEGTVRSGLEVVGLREVDPSDDDDGCRFEVDVRSRDGKGEPTPIATLRARAVLAADGVGSTVRSLAPKERKAEELFLNEKRSVWRGISPSLDCRGQATFFRAASSGEGGGTGSSALVFPAGVEGGASWTVIIPTMEGRAVDEADAQRRALAAAVAACPEGTEPPELLRTAILGSSRVVEHRLAVRDFDYPYGSATDGLAFLGDAQHPVRPTGEGLALAWGDAAELGHAIAARAKSKAFSCEEWAEVFRSYESSREPVVREVSERVRASAESFYTKANEATPSSE